MTKHDIDAAEQIVVDAQESFHHHPSRPAPAALRVLWRMQFHLNVLRSGTEIAYELERRNPAHSVSDLLAEVIPQHKPVLIRRNEDAESAATEAYWQAKQGDDYGSY